MGNTLNGWIKVAAAAAFGSFLVVAEELPTNPFKSISSHVENASAADVGQDEIGNQKEEHPLRRTPLSQYTVMGVLVSSKGNVAMVRTRSNEEFFVHVDDFLGNGGGQISQITSQGIEVREEGRVILVSVRNRGINN